MTAALSTAPPPTVPPAESGFARIGAAVVRRARLVLALSVVALLASVGLGIGAFGALLSGGFDDPDSGSTQAQQLLDRDFGGSPDLVFLVHARAGRVDAPEVTAAGRSLAARLADEPGLTSLASYWEGRAPGLVSSDGTYALVLVTLSGDDTQAEGRATELLADYSDVDSAAATVRIGGPLGNDIGGQVGRDLALAESIAVPLTLVLLVLAFGSVVAALLPLAVSVLAIFGTFAELFVLTRFTDVSVFAINLTTALGLGLGIDYALLTVSRYREELAGGATPAEAAIRTVATAGRTIAFSALTVAAALSALLVFPVYFLRSFAYAGVAVTLFSALAAVLVLPALLAVLGTRVNAGRLPWAKTLRGSEAPIWGRLAQAVMRRPLLTALPVVAVLLVAATPLLNVQFGTPDDRVLPVSAPAHQVGDVLRRDFAGNATATIDVVTTSATSATDLGSYARRLAALPGVQRVDSSAGSFTSGGPAEPAPPGLRSGAYDRVSVALGIDPASAAAQDLVRDVRAQAPPAGTTVLVGGSSAALVDAKRAISSRLPLAGSIIVLTTLVLLFLFTGSVVQPLRALVGNLLTLGATLGVMVWIFQDGNLSSVLGFTPSPTNTAMPVLLFCIAFGLSMDYEVFLLSRVKELHDAGASSADAVVFGLSRTGRIVSTAAGLLAVSFFAFGTSKVSFIQLFGLGTGLAILLDATLVRGVLVPASMRLFGERSWWAPAPLRRVYARVGMSEA